MGWLKVSDALPDSPKFDCLSDAAFRLWVMAGCWCRKQENSWLGGTIQHAALPIIARGKWRRKRLYELANELVNASVGSRTGSGLWEVCDEGWRIHDFEQYNPIDALTRSDLGRIGGLKSAEVRRARTGSAIPSNAPNRRPSPKAFGLASAEAETEATEAPSPPERSRSLKSGSKTCQVIAVGPEGSEGFGGRMTAEELDAALEKREAI